MIKAVVSSLLVAVVPHTVADEERVNPADTRLYELRTYHAAPGKLDALLARFRDHTCGLFEKHGMTNVGYWVPVENEGGRLIYLLSYPDRVARDSAWKGFLEDEAWRKAAAASEVDGKLVMKIEEIFLTSTNFSPGFSVAAEGAAERLYELRTYTATTGKLPALHARFRDHTLGLFTRHGITHGGYFQLVEGQPAAEDTLLYFLTHRNAASAEKSWAAFRADPQWVAAKAASEDAAGGSLTAPEGVKSIYLKPVDFSVLK